MRSIETLRTLSARRVEYEMTSIVLNAQKEELLQLPGGEVAVGSAYDAYLDCLSLIVEINLAIRHLDHTIVAVQALIEGSKSPAPSPSHRYTIGEDLYE